MNIESRFGANKGGRQPSQMLYLANQENVLLAHTLDCQILEEIAHKTSENFDISTRFWPKSRSYSKQGTKPFLPGATTTSVDAEAHTRGAGFFCELWIRRNAAISARGSLAKCPPKSSLPRAAAKSMCGTLGIWGNSEVA
jgi:hypothetical protein